MTHSLINVLATFSTAGNRYVEYVSKIVIITLAIVLVAKEIFHNILDYAERLIVK